jgi:hypothetical protein
VAEADARLLLARFQRRHLRALPARQRPQLLDLLHGGGERGLEAGDLPGAGEPHRDGVVGGEAAVGAEVDGAIAEIVEQDHGVVGRQQPPAAQAGVGAGGLLVGVVVGVVVAAVGCRVAATLEGRGVDAFPAPRGAGRRLRSGHAARSFAARGDVGDHTGDLAGGV